YELQGAMLDGEVRPNFERRVYRVRIHEDRDPSEYDYLEWRGRVTPEQAEKVRRALGIEDSAPEQVEIARGEIRAAEEALEAATPGYEEALQIGARDTIPTAEEEARYASLMSAYHEAIDRLQQAQQNLADL